MKIALLGYGRMGRAVEAAAKARGHVIALCIDADNAGDFARLTAQSSDVAVEFTNAQAAPDLLRALARRGGAVVSGSTGWHDAHLAEILDAFRAANTPFVYGTNFSVGAQLMFRLNRDLARLMAPHPQYDVYIEERHHAGKSDAPSGTARSLAEDVMAGLGRKTRIATAADLAERAPAPEELSVASVRAGLIYGEHTVAYVSETDRIALSHQAFSRAGFGDGAVRAAEWLLQYPGVWAFPDLLARAAQG